MWAAIGETLISNPRMWWDMMGGRQLAHGPVWGKDYFIPAFYPARGAAWLLGWTETQQDTIYTYAGAGVVFLLAMRDRG
jgi:hypothetical protein